MLTNRQTRRATLGCTGWGLCGRGVSQGGAELWPGATTPPGAPDPADTMPMPSPRARSPHFLRHCWHPSCPWLVELPQQCTEAPAVSIFS